jgi:hypothetical protein
MCPSNSMNTVCGLSLWKFCAAGPSKGPASRCPKATLASENQPGAGTKCKCEKGGHRGHENVAKHLVAPWQSGESRQVAAPENV